MPRSNKAIGLSDLRVGLFVVAAIAVLIFLILNASGEINPFKRKLHLRARFASADGLRKGADVNLAGVRVGRVDDIKLLGPDANAGDQKVEVAISIDGKIDGISANDRIRTDSTAQLVSSSLLGNERNINISQGTTVGQPVSDNYLLPSSTASDFSNLASSGNDLVQRLTKISDQVNDLVGRVNSGQGTVGKLLNDEAFYNNLNSATRNADELIRQINTGQGSAGRFVNDPELYNNAAALSRNLHEISERISGGRGTVGRLINDEELYNRINNIATRADRTLDQIQGLVGDVQAGRGTLGKLVTDEAIYNDARAAIARFNTTAERVDNVVAGAQRGEGTLGKLITDDQL
ncbi:MAG TPA: MlaD family protein, partial [Pyrinomonadaceae bacterium]|nr:MlaD family protein [Pyrinomonadaceae bacterium]